MPTRTIELETPEESTYECFSCGTIVCATAPQSCPNCGTDMRNRGTAIE
ncbi:rubrerythrin-like domain-containing protein [Natrarchaeobaculum sulfurireducens]|nr:rubrerythrin-like domain-containing protein [Natrarchaeobaculum sulfurireducens]